MSFSTQIKKTLSLALPMILGQIIGMSMSMVDASMLGRGIGTDALAALGFGVNIVNIPAIAGFGMITAISILTSQAWGANLKDKCTDILRHGMLASTIYSVVIFVVITLLVENLHRFNNFGQPEAIVQLARPYIYLLTTAFAFGYLSAALRAMCEAQSRPWPPLLVLSTTITANIFFNWIFIFGNLGAPKLGLVGAGIGSLLSQIYGFIAISVVVLGSGRFMIQAKELFRFQFTWEHLKQEFSLGLPACLQILGEVSSFTIAALMIGSLGKVDLAAHHASMQVAAMSFMVPMAISFAVAIRVGQARGANNYPLIRVIARSSQVFALGISSISAVLFILFRNQLPTIFSTDPAVIELASKILIIAGLFQVADGIQVTCTGILRGLADLRIPMMIALTGYMAVAIPCGYILGFVCGYGTLGIWWALALGLFIAAAALSWRVHIQVHRDDRRGAVAQVE